MKKLIIFLQNWTAWIAVLLLLPASIYAGNSTSPPPAVEVVALANLEADLAEVAATRKPLLLIFSAEHCYYCERLEENIVKPMLRSGDYDDRVLIRKVDLDDPGTLTGRDGKPVTTLALGSEYGIRVTPTVLLLGPNGEELAPRQLGINNEDYYGAYLDAAIEQARERLRGR